MKYTDLVNSLFADGRKIYEVRHPAPGIRNSKRVEYVRHRFPVKGGLSFAEVTEMRLCQSNSLLAHLRSSKAIKQ